MAPAADAFVPICFNISIVEPSYKTFARIAGHLLGTWRLQSGDLTVTRRAYLLNYNVD